MKPEASAPNSKYLKPASTDSRRPVKKPASTYSGMVAVSMARKSMTMSLAMAMSIRPSTEASSNR